MSTDLVKLSATQLSTELSTFAGQLPGGVEAASAVAIACTSLLLKQNLQWERAVDGLATAQQEAAAAAAASVAKPALPGLRSGAPSSAGGAVKPPSGSQTPAGPGGLSQAALQAQAAEMLMQQQPARSSQRVETESEDEEKNVVPLSRVKLPTSADDVESDAASVCSASTLEMANGVQLPAMRRSRPS